MSTVDHRAREVRSNIIDCGPGLVGKTTNLQFVYRMTRPEARGRMIEVATDAQHTLSFEWAPSGERDRRGYWHRFTITTVPGAVFRAESRRLISAGADAVVFVADSLEARREANIESWEAMVIDLGREGIDFESVPGVRQFNKRDLPSVASIVALDAMLPHSHWPYVPAVAARGVGVMGSLTIAAQQVQHRVNGSHGRS